ncbi:MAG: Glycerophosphoryl diester phosphodiesterase [Hyphomicrobiales bacterium]|nr:Glycerophosphoryl diester phosphodiesterase [Hyphomicrobiales bacterium]
MSDGIAYVANGHRTLLKWHRARRQAGDLAFTGERLLEGMALGASVEVDLRKHASGGFAVLHDATLDRETTGCGPVSLATAETLRSLFLRDGAGAPTSHPLMLLEDLTALLAGKPIAEGARLQLDLKENSAILTEADLRAFTMALRPLARHFILSGGDAEAVDRLSRDLPALQIGYDPCNNESLAAIETSKDFSGLVRDALDASPSASTIYLEHRLVLFAADRGFDLIGAFHQGGRHIDAYTLRTAEPDDVAIACRLIALKVDQITTDDPIGLEIRLHEILVRPA